MFTHGQWQDVPAIPDTFTINLGSAVMNNPSPPLPPPPPPQPHTRHPVRVWTSNCTSQLLSAPFAVRNYCLTKCYGHEHPACLTRHKLNCEA